MKSSLTGGVQRISSLTGDWRDFVPRRRIFAETIQARCISNRRHQGKIRICPQMKKWILVDRQTGTMKTCTENNNNNGGQKIQHFNANAN